MTDQTKMTKRQAIEELRQEALEIEKRALSIKDYASNAHKIKIRRDLADQFERELALENSTKQD